MVGLTRPLLLCGATLLIAACTRVVGGTASATFGGDRQGMLDVATILLDQSRMQAITGSGDDLTIIPTMDTTYPVDVDDFAQPIPRECRFIYAETAVFGSEIEAFHKTTFQDRPDGSLISEAVAAYRDAGTARRAFDTLAVTVHDCAASPAGWLFVSRWTAAAIPYTSGPRLRSRLPGPIGGPVGSDLLRLPGIGLRHRDDEHRRQRAGLAPRARVQDARTDVNVVSCALRCATTLVLTFPPRAFSLRRRRPWLDPHGAGPATDPGTTPP